MKIVVYSKPDCVQCRYTKQELTKLGLIFENIDVTLDRAAERDVRDMGLGTTLPIVVVSYANGGDSQKWSGLKLDKIRALKP